MYNKRPFQSSECVECRCPTKTQNVSDFNTFSFLLLFPNPNVLSFFFVLTSSKPKVRKRRKILSFERRRKPNAFSSPYVLVFHVWIAFKKYIWIQNDVHCWEILSVLWGIWLFGVPDAFSLKLGWLKFLNSALLCIVDNVLDTFKKYEWHFPNRHQKLDQISQAQPNTFSYGTLLKAI